MFRAALSGLLGCAVALAPLPVLAADGSRFDRPPSDQNKRYHMILLAENESGRDAKQPGESPLHLEEQHNREPRLLAVQGTAELRG